MPCIRAGWKALRSKQNDNLAFFCTYSIDACHICCLVSISNLVILTSFSHGQNKKFQ